MFLSRVNILGFKGIKQLSIDLNHNSNVLIGENRWGQSSLIDALMLLSLDKLSYQFVENDFFKEEDYQPNDATIQFIFCERYANELQSAEYRSLEAVTYQTGQGGKKMITLQIRAKKHSRKISTYRDFLDQNEQRIAIKNTDELVKLLINLNPMMRLRNPIDHNQLPIDNQPLSHYYVEQLSQQLTEHSKLFSPEDLSRGLTAARALLEYYLADGQRRNQYKNVAKRATPTHEEWASLERINNLLDDLDNDYVRTILLEIFSALFIAQEENPLQSKAVPMLILEEPESQLHPIILSVGFRLLKNFPTQKFITTNSSDLVAQFPLENIYHLIRKPTGIIAMHIGENGLSTDDKRRILFHILYHRAVAIFARCWLLVEGETEVWLLRELAEQCGHHLNPNGIQVLEFAQCGLKPLIKYANKMGIQWFVLTDGDVAGKKYADTVRSLLPPNCDISDYLTLLPARDIENFLFKNGFSHVYKQIGFNTTEHIDLPINRIIQKAIHKTSKPDLAIAICDDVKARGVSSVPSLFKHTFEKVIKRAKESY